MEKVTFSSHRLQMMGTWINLQVKAVNSQDILRQAIHRLFVYESRFSANDPSSELMAVNQMAGRDWVAVHPELFYLIKVGKKHSIAQPSILNIAIGPLVQLWRIGFSDAKKPNQPAIDRTLNLINPYDIYLDDKNQRVKLAKTGMAIDLGALAKGHIADLIIDYFKAAGAVSGLINLGGNIKTLGPPINRPQDNYWRIGLQNPKKSRGEHIAILQLEPGQSVVTSGTYERCLKLDYNVYHHIFDSRTGYPLTTSLASLTVVSKQSLQGEIWTSRLFNFSGPQIRDLHSLDTDIKLIAIDQSNHLYYGSDFANQVLQLA
ncbi:hypothetical protein AWM75_01450 [Aerococcus urinaehominis]|uniref:FAD:protein FMN transferase n=1 Tax=Aerococcus urinaehominis TaxID=128944 RepID=A0A109RHE7_9LACT|nr:FAD:protein FMN transferase [Aerococcus urinaehominis]AMB98741.1 hypothetical protein AWM75_01450 [Aerococcus urinaehominis]SDM63233.1 thiamine biosynthesis lipoprotein [Aerococcus urinaehominis]